ncbi:MAG: prolipoprotein diacylglyceryl transferase [Planctomycetes bacterium]|nr:prolipoprotein diacylglyceryl transferase [Planctomycetota bacterium]
MWPTVIKIPFLGIPINTYGLAIMIGFLLAVWVWLKRVKQAGFSVDFALDVSIIVMLSGLVGGKIASVITNYSAYQNEIAVFNFFDGKLDPLGSLAGLIPLIVFLFLNRSKQVNFFNKIKGISIWTLICVIAGMRISYVLRNSSEFNYDFFKKWQAGFALYGGLIVGMIAGIVYARWKKQPVLKLLDIAAPAILLGIAIGRIGCFASGCCYGLPCDEKNPQAWCVKFPKGDSREGTAVFARHRQLNLVTDQDQFSKPVHPTQLYETVACLFGFFLLSFIWKKQFFDGLIVSLMGMFYSVWRFINEFIRDDPERLSGSIFGLTWPQELSIIVFLFSFIMLFYFKRRASRLKLQSEITP